MILTDASVIIAFIRGDAKLASLLPTLPVAVCGVTVSEVLAGGRSASEYAHFDTILSRFTTVPLPPSTWPQVGRNLATLYAAGLSIPFPDVTVATLGIITSIEVWARDKHFPAMQPHLPGLRLFAEP